MTEIGGAMAIRAFPEGEAPVEPQGSAKVILGLPLVVPELPTARRGREQR